MRCDKVRFVKTVWGGSGARLRGMSRPSGAVATRLLLVAALASGCAREQPRPAPAHELHKAEPEVVLRPDGVEPAHVKVELAVTEPEQRKGLMYRDKLEMGRGMLFI